MFALLGSWHSAQLLVLCMHQHHAAFSFSAARLLPSPCLQVELMVGSSSRATEEVGGLMKTKHALEMKILTLEEQVRSESKCFTDVHGSLSAGSGRKRRSVGSRSGEDGGWANVCVSMMSTHSSCPAVRPQRLEVAPTRGPQAPRQCRT